jgi:Fe-Mn family superoxide dismutase
MSFTLPDLPYAYDALEPYIDKTTMQIHHDKHHAGYVNKLNDAVKGTELENKDLKEILAQVSKTSSAVRNNAGGDFNHSFFWPQMGANAGGEPKGKLADAINSTWGDFSKFKAEFAKAAGARFGSGWAWLGVQDGKLVICSTPNQDNPLMDVADCRCTPIFGIDVWEHAYYLKYQNRRPDYVEAYWNLVRWDVIGDRYEKAVS